LSEAGRDQGGRPSREPGRDGGNQKGSAEALMANFMGGSAPAMASQVAGGFILLSANSLRGFAPGELTNLRFELDKLLREVRAEVPPQQDALAQQARNHKIARISSAMQVVTNQMTARR
jgi:hypothetical protein